MTINSKKSFDLVAAILDRLRRGLTAPFVSLQKAGDYTRSSTTAAFLLLSMLVVSIEQNLVGNLPRAVLALLIGGYFLARTRWFSYAGLILIFSLSFPSYLQALRLQSPEPQQVMSAMVWVIIPLLMTSLIYPVHITVALGLTNLLALAVLPFIQPRLNWSRCRARFWRDGLPASSWAARAATTLAASSRCSASSRFT